MNLTQLTDTEKQVLNKFEKYVFEKCPSNAFLVQLIELAFDYLNAESVQQCADRLGISYNGVKKTRPVMVIQGNKYVIDNE